MSHVLTLAWLTFHEARRRRMVLAALIIGALFVTLFGVGFWLINNELRNEDTPLLATQQIHSFLTIAGLYVVHFLTVMLAIFASADTVSGEIVTHTIQTIVTKPARRWQVLLGKWLGYALMLPSYLLLLCGGVILVARLISGYAPPNVAQGIGLLMLESLVLVSLSLLGGTRLSTLTNGVMLFLLYALTFIGAWVEQIGALLQSSAAVRVGIVTSLLLPVESLWRRAASLMQPPLANAIPTPFAVSSVPSPAMVVYAVLYGVVALLLAMRVFGRRDL
jgi:ABC-type transport system involved in multi-copper enzyme maturation permease subunit